MPDGVRHIEVVPADSATLGGYYQTLRGRRVIVRSKSREWVVLWSATTGHLVSVGLDYELIPVWETLL